MLTIILSRALVFAAAACTGVAAYAVDAGPVASPVYRLSIENPDAFRFAAHGVYALAPKPVKETMLPTQLANLPYAVQIDSAAREAALDPALVHALIYVESRYNPAARSAKGALGLMQLLPETAARYGVAKPAHSLETHLRAGTRYLSDLLQLFDGRVELALAAYNAGENAVQRYGHRIPPYRETLEYVPAVLEKYREWRTPPASKPAPSPARTRIQYLPGTIFEPDLPRAAALR